MVCSVVFLCVVGLWGSTTSSGPGTLSRLNFPSGDNCQVTLHLTGSGYLSTNFEMDFEPGYGTLSFYDGPTTSGSFLGSWNSPELQVAACQALTPFLTVVWTSGQLGTSSLILLKSHPWYPQNPPGVSVMRWVPFMGWVAFMGWVHLWESKNKLPYGRN